MLFTESQIKNKIKRILKVSPSGFEIFDEEMSPADQVVGFDYFLKKGLRPEMEAAGITEGVYPVAAGYYGNYVFFLPNEDNEVLRRATASFNASYVMRCKENSARSTMTDCKTRRLHSTCFNSMPPAPPDYEQRWFED